MDDRPGHHKFSCRYPNCNNKFFHPIYKKGYKNKRFYHFPRNKYQLSAWKEICKIAEDVCTDNFRICEDHFSAKCFNNPVNRRLISSALPRNQNKDFSVKDHEYLVTDEDEDIQKILGISKYNYNSSILSSDLNCVNLSLDKRLSFLENIQDCVLTTSNSDSQNVSSEVLSKKSRVLSIHESVVSKVSLLKTILQNQTNYVKILHRLYKYGKFNCISQFLRHLSNEFIQSKLKYLKNGENQWTKEDKALALTLYNKDEKLYKYLCTSFYLPSIITIKHVMCKVPINREVNQNIFTYMEKKVNSLNSGDRTCILLMNEMLLTSKLYYDQTHQYICGHEDLDFLGRSKREADHVLVLTARGLRSNWIQVISYNFSSIPINDINVQNVIVKTINQLQMIGLKVMGVVSKQNSLYQKALSQMCVFNGYNSSLNYFRVNGNEICIIFDPRHLLIDTKNAFTKCNFFYDASKSKVAKFEDIEYAYNIDCAKRAFKHLFKLKEEYFAAKGLHVTESISAAATIFSHSVAGSIETFVHYGDMPEEAMCTAEFVETVDKLFDSLNGSAIQSQDYKKYRCALAAGSPHLKFWAKLLDQISKWTLVDLESKEDVTSNYQFIEGWETTIKSISYIWRHLKYENNFNYLSLKRFNLEPLENLFERIKQYGTDNKQPTCRQFITGLLNELLIDEKDLWVTENCYSLCPLKVYTNFSDEISEGSNTYADLCEIYFDDLDFPKVNVLEFHEATAYISGYLLKKIGVPRCDDCRSFLLAEWIVSNNSFTIEDCADDSTYLLCASDHVIRVVDRIMFLSVKFLRDLSNDVKLEEKFKDLYKSDCQLPDFCKIHTCSEDLVNLCIKFCFYRITTKNHIK